MATSKNEIGGGEMTVIGRDTRIKGEMHFENGARILGHFEGRIASKGEVQIGDGATCEAAVTASRITVDGTVRGDMHAADNLTLNAKADVTGDIVAANLIVCEGATFVGHCSVGPNAQPASRPASAPAPEIATRKVELPEPKAKAASAPAEDLDGDVTPPWKAEAVAASA